MKCYFGPEDWAEEQEGRAIAVHGSGDPDRQIIYTASASLSATCEICHRRPASWLATDTRSEPWQDRGLCEFCTAAQLAPHAIADAERLEGWVAALSDKGHQSAAKETREAVERLERWWKRLPPPRDVVAALDRCRCL
jgi:hypothetical protein